MRKAYLHLPELASISRTTLKTAPSGVINKIVLGEQGFDGRTIDEVGLLCYFCVVLGYSTVGDATAVLDNIKYEYQSMYANMVDKLLQRENSSGIIRVFNDLEYVVNVRDKGKQHFEVTYV